MKKKTKADIIALKEPRWISIELKDELPKKNQYVRWLCTNGTILFCSRSLNYKGFLKDTGPWGPRYWRPLPKRFPK